jgi:hypothetical protein
VDRRTWLRERRQTAEERYDTINAFTYDDQYGEIGPTHARFLADLLGRCPPRGSSWTPPAGPASTSAWSWTPAAGWSAPTSRWGC